jgi:phosphoribosylanthranilate isomerase
MQSALEVKLALAAGATCVGFVGEGLTPPGCLSDDAIIAMTAGIGDRRPIVLLTPHATVDGVVEQQGRVRAGALQLCCPFDAPALTELRRHLPGIRLIQVVHMGDPGGLERAQAVAGVADVVLLDSGTTQGGTQVFGGTGRVHDWRRSAAIVEALDTPVWLAGGLNPTNVGDAITQVRPAGVDVCSGLRPEGVLVESLVGDFVSAVMGAGQRG